MHRLTKSGQNVLRVDLMDFDNHPAHAKYGSFSVASESESYSLNIANYSGNARDSLDWHNGMKFSTNDKDNDQTRRENCAVSYRGGWWYRNCHYSNLNGLYLQGKARLNQGMRWCYWKNDNRSMKKPEMKIRPAGF